MKDDIFYPSEFIQDEIDARGWSVEDLAHHMGAPIHCAKLVLCEETVITGETAEQLSKAFGSSVQFWINAENAIKR